MTLPNAKDNGAILPDLRDLRSPLSRRETEVFHWIAAGKTDWEISQIIGISAKTVNYHVENVKRRYGVGTRVQAIVAVVRDGMLDA